MRERVVVHVRERVGAQLEAREAPRAAQRAALDALHAVARQRPATCARQPRPTRPARRRGTLLTGLRAAATAGWPVVLLLASFLPTACQNNKPEIKANTLHDLLHY